MSMTPYAINEALVKAAGQGDLKAVQEWVLQKKADLCHQSREIAPGTGFFSALAWAAYHGKLETVQWILSQPQGLESCKQLSQKVGDKATTVLHHAICCDPSIRGKNFAVIKLISHAFPQALKIENQYGNLPLHYTLIFGEGDLASLAFLLMHSEAGNKQDDHGNALLHMASKRAAVVEFLLQKFPESRLTVNQDGLKPPLLSAARQCNASGMKVILNHFPELVEQRDAQDNTALHWVINLMLFANRMENETASMNLIMDRFPDVCRLVDNAGLTAMATAAQCAQNPPENRNPESGNKAIVVMGHLLGLGDFIDDITVYYPGHKMVSEARALFELAHNRGNNRQKTNLSKEELKLMADCGLRINARSFEEQEGNTALHIAVQNGDRILVQHLLLSGARVDLKNSVGEEGQTVLDLALASEDSFLKAMVSFFAAKQWLLRLEEEYQDFHVRAQNPWADVKVTEENKEIAEIQGYLARENKHHLERIENIFQEIVKLRPEIVNFKKFLAIMPEDRQAELRLYLTKLLATVDVHGELRPLSDEMAVLVYEMLKQIPETSDFYKTAQKCMHSLLIGSLVLVPKRFAVKPGEVVEQHLLSEPVPMARKTVFSDQRDKKGQAELILNIASGCKEISFALKHGQMQVAPANGVERKGEMESKFLGEALSLDEIDDEVSAKPVQALLDPREVIQKLTLQWKIVHLVIADHQAKELVMYIAEFLSGPEFWAKTEISKQQIAIRPMIAMAETIHKEIIAQKYYRSPLAVLKILESYGDQDKQRLLAENIALREENQRLVLDKNSWLAERAVLREIIEDARKQTKQAAEERARMEKELQTLRAQQEQMREQLARLQGAEAGAQAGGAGLRLAAVAAATAVNTNTVAEVSAVNDDAAAAVTAVNESPAAKMQRS